MERGPRAATVSRRRRLTEDPSNQTYLRRSGILTPVHQEGPDALPARIGVTTPRATPGHKAKRPAQSHPYPPPPFRKRSGSRYHAEDARPPVLAGPSRNRPPRNPRRGYCGRELAGDTPRVAARCCRACRPSDLHHVFGSAGNSCGAFDSGPNPGAEERFCGYGSSEPTDYSDLFVFVNLIPAIPVLIGGLLATLGLSRLFFPAGVVLGLVCTGLIWALEP
jgi:hypothetical protein